MRSFILRSAVIIPIILCPPWQLPHFPASLSPVFSKSRLLNSQANSPKSSSVPVALFRDWLLNLFFRALSRSHKQLGFHLRRRSLRAHKLQRLRPNGPF